MIRVEALPAGHGDAIWIEYGAHAHAPRRVLIDGGTASCIDALRARVLRAAATSSDGIVELELMVVTHIDGDHIGGALALLEDPPPGLRVNEIWFNGYRHLLPRDALGHPEANALEALLAARYRAAWNRSWGGEDSPVVLTAEGEALPAVTLPGGLHITLLSPTRDRLAGLEPRWRAYLARSGIGIGIPADQLGALAREAEKDEDELPADALGRDDSWPPDIRTLAASRFSSDPSRANASSIAFLAGYDGRLCLFAADAVVEVLLGAIKRHLAPLGKSVLDLDVLKVSHHASARNTSSELLACLRCARYLISTNGDVFGHPDHAALARIIVHGAANLRGARPVLLFNCENSRTRPWRDRAPPGAPPYDVVFPQGREAVACVFAPA